MGENIKGIESAKAGQLNTDGNVSSDIWKSRQQDSLSIVKPKGSEDAVIDFTKAPALYAQLDSAQNGKTLGTAGDIGQGSATKDYSEQVREFHRNAGRGVELLDSTQTLKRTSTELDLVKSMLAKGDLSKEDQLRAAQVLVSNNQDSFTDATGKTFKIELGKIGDQQHIRLLQNTGGEMKSILHGVFSGSGQVLQIQNDQHLSQDSKTRGAGLTQDTRLAQGAATSQDKTSQETSSITGDTAITDNTAGPGDDYSRKVVDFLRRQGHSSVELDDSLSMKRTSTELDAVKDVLSNKDSSLDDKLRAVQVLGNNNINTFKLDGLDYKIDLSKVNDQDLVKFIQVSTDGQMKEMFNGSLSQNGQVLELNGKKFEIKADAPPPPPGADKPPEPYTGKPLFNPALTPEERLKEADKMYKNGEKTVTGPDGKVYEIREQQVGKRSVVGIFTKGEDGKDHPILRGVVDQDSTVRQQRDGKGNPVDYQSDYAKKHAKDSPLMKTERTEKPPKHEDPPSGDKPADRVKKAAEKLEPPEDRKKFLSDMEKFEARAKRENLPQEEIDKTYKEMARLMEAKDGKVPAADRQLLAKNLMYHLGEPSNIDQGQHNTCNVTTIQERTMTKHPSKAVEIAVTTALTGQWVAPDGKVIKIDPSNLKPDNEGRKHPPVDGARSYATQLMNLAMVNDIKQREMPPKFYKQERPTSNTDTGERLYYANGQRCPESAPHVTINAMADFMKRLSGDTGVLMVDGQIHQNNGAHPDQVPVASEADFGAKLQQMQAGGKLPAIIMVDANDKLFFGGSAAQNGQWHVVSITGYDAKTGKVRISNQWGKPQDREVPLADLYRSMNLGRTPPPPKPPTK